MQVVREFWIGILGVVVGGLVSLAAWSLLPEAIRTGSAVAFYSLLPVAAFALLATFMQIRNQGCRRWTRSLFGVDLRALAAMRIGIAISILVDLGIRARDLEAHYSDAGILPLEMIRRVTTYPHFLHPSDLSLHVLYGATWFQALLFLIAAAFAIALLVGYRSRLACFACWLMLVSLHCRNPVVQTGGDTLLRMLLFWGIFLPLGARFSLDRVRQTVWPYHNRRFANVATFALIVQITCVYTFSGLLKTDDMWRVDGSAVYFALSIDGLATPFGRSLLAFPGLLRAISFAVLYLELAAPFLIFMPWRNTAFRGAFVFLFSFLHVGFWLCMYIGIFPLVGLVAVSALIPAPAWDWLERQLARRKAESTALGQYFRHVAKAINCRLPRASIEKERPRQSLLNWSVQAPTAAALLYVVTFNLSTLPQLNNREQSDWFREPSQINLVGQTVTINPSTIYKVGRQLRLDQSWHMFAPYPLLEDGWCVAVGKTVNGDDVDAWSTDAVSFDKPDSVAATNVNNRWRKVVEFIRIRGRHTQHQDALCAYLCRRWNENHSADQQLRQLTLYFVYEFSRPPGEIAPIRKRLLTSCQCDG